MVKREVDPEPEAPPEKLIPAKWPILAILVIAVAMASFAWLYWYSIGNDIKAYWGPENTLVIARAPEAELWELGGADTASTDQVVLVGDQQLAVVRRRDLIKRPPPGWSHVRTLLVRDAAFDFQDKSPCGPHWSHAISFREKEQRVIVLLSTDCPRARLADGAREVLPDGSIRSDRTLRKGAPAETPLSIAPIAEGLKTFLSEQMERPAEKPGQALESLPAQGDGREQ